jgi:hypothetical protein
VPECSSGLREIKRATGEKGEREREERERR